MTVEQPALRRDAGGLYLGGHAATANIGTRFTGHAQHVIGDASLTSGMCSASAFAPGIGRIKAVHIG